ncbi:MAG: hypothetical protein AABY00_02700 [Nanoarchaeota archaeon]
MLVKLRPQHVHRIDLFHSAKQQGIPQAEHIFGYTPEMRARQNVVYESMLPTSKNTISAIEITGGLDSLCGECIKPQKEPCLSEPALRQNRVLAHLYGAPLGACFSTLQFWHGILKDYHQDIAERIRTQSFRDFARAGQYALDEDIDTAGCRFGFEARYLRRIDLYFNALTRGLEHRESVIDIQPSPFMVDSISRVAQKMLLFDGMKEEVVFTEGLNKDLIPYNHAIAQTYNIQIDIPYSGSEILGRLLCYHAYTSKSLSQATF